MKYRPLAKPADPGFYWVATESRKSPHLVQVCVESDSHDMYYVLIPGDDKKHPLDLWPGAIWFGPIAEEDISS